MLAGGDEHAVAPVHLVHPRHAAPALHPRAKRLRARDERPVQPVARERQRGERQVRSRHAPPVRQPHLADRLRSQVERFDPQRAQLADRLDAQELTADLVVRAALALDHQRPVSAKREMARGGRARDAAADDRWSAHLLRSTHRRNGKRHTTFASLTPARASSACQSRLRKARATESGPSCRTNGCQRITRESSAKP